MLRSMLSGGTKYSDKDAEIDEVIEQLPQGYDTIIGGDSLGSMSSGQLQRICMARALYKKPSVLLLHENNVAAKNITVLENKYLLSTFNILLEQNTPSYYDTGNN
jgi:ABC-type transport system involved in Fe-S cluster assembly fused permease/ATPase subunit